MSSSTLARAILLPLLMHGCLALEPATAEPSDQPSSATGLTHAEPTEPDKALATLRTGPAFRVELAAAEPLVRDPVAIAFDEQGRAYVIELPEYNQYAKPETTASGDAAPQEVAPQGAVPRMAARSSIRLLEDTDHDGQFDKSTIFADELNYATGLACYDGGLIVGAAPDLLYLKDADGDGKAELREILLTGFGRDSSGEGQLNSFHWGLDNRLHISTGLDGGDVRPAAKADALVRSEAIRKSPRRRGQSHFAPRTAQNRDSPRRSPDSLSVHNRTLLFDPRSRQFELTSGGGQHGVGIDDWGRTFVCDNSDPARLLIYDDRYVARNPFMAAPPPAVSIAPDGKNTQVLRISPPDSWRVLRTSMRSQGLFPGSDEGGQVTGFFTAGTGVTIYRGDAWPDEYRGNLLVGEAANNLVYRARLEPAGVSLVAQRADPDAEFLASTDNWFRPVQLANAPDGTLYVLDMYRELIEGAAFLPPQIFAQLDPTAGCDRGRIYRIVPEGFEQPRPVRLDQQTTPALVGLLEHSNGWHRDTAARLLYERRDAAAVEPLRDLLSDSKFPQARMHALYALDGLDALDAADVRRGLLDPHPRVREHALRLAERFADSAAEIQQIMLGLHDDPDVLVRYQLAFSLGALPASIRDAALVEILDRDGADIWFRVAAQSSVGTGAGTLLRLLLTDEKFRSTSAGLEFLAALARQVALADQAEEIDTVMQGLTGLDADATKPIARAVVLGLLESRGGAAQRRLAESTGAAHRIFVAAIAEAQRTALDDAQPVNARGLAVRTLAQTSFAAQRDVFAELLEPRQPQSLQAAALEALAALSDDAVADLLLSKWSTLTPQLRMVAAETLFSRPPWTARLLDAVVGKEIPAGDIDPVRVAALQSHPDLKLRERTAQAFAGIGIAGRAEVVANYQPALKLSGDVERGREQFRKVCAACHRLEDVGTAVGADLQAIRERGVEAIMLNILDPNREVKPPFLTYVVATDDGQTITGMIAEEAANTITLRRPDGALVSVPRAEIESIRSTGMSYMPEGLEKQVDHQAMADLLEYLNTIR